MLKTFMLFLETIALLHRYQQDFQQVISFFWERHGEVKAEQMEVLFWLTIDRSQI